MELIRVENSKIISLFWIAPDPKGGLPHLPAVAQTIVDRYKFQNYPKTVDELVSDGASFIHGSFEGSAIERLDVYSDGLMVSTKADTARLDGFLNDLFELMKAEFGCRPVKTHEIDKLYESDLLFKTEKDILGVLDKLQDIQNHVAGALKKVSGLNVAFTPLGLSFAADTASIPGLKPVPFRVERKLGLTFELNYYVSGAPLPTNEHLAVLEMLEELA